jgi:Zn-dependent metalloprotease
MKKHFSLLGAAMAFLFIVGSLCQNIQAQYNYVNLSSTRIDDKSEEYEKLKNAGLKYLEEELGKETDREQASPTEFKVLYIQRDALEIAHVRIQQTFKGVPVLGGEAIVHINRDDSLNSITDDIIPEVDEAKLDANPRISLEEAIKKAFEAERCGECKLSEDYRPLLAVYATKQDLQAGDREIIETDARLVYVIRLAQTKPTDREDREPRLPIYYIDAQTGEIVLSYNNIQTQSVTNSGSTLYSGGVNFTAFKFGGIYYLENLNFNRRIGTFNGSTSNRYQDADGFWTAAAQRPAVDVHWGTEKTLEYYGNVFGRNGVNGTGGPLSVPAVDGSTNLLPSTYLSGFGYNNAYWDGSSMTYGDGDGWNFGPFVSLDVVGHEITHGVTQFESGLIYWNESGGLNEAASDIFGNMIERYVKGASANNWKVGEEFYTPGTPGDALRYMDNPHNDGASIDHYSEYYPGIDVHYSSGIANKEFHLLSQGGTHHKGGSMTGIGADRAAAIWYYALTNLMSSNTNFLGARNATVNAANILYGPTEVDAVKRSWCMVGVGPCGDIIYSARVKVGIFNVWLPWVSNGATAGTTGQSRPMRAVRIIVNNVNGMPGVGVTYRAHISGAGWLGWTSNGGVAGSNTWLLGPQMEAVQVFLTGAPAGCNVQYQAHVANFGWLGWVQNGATAGTTGQGRRMEAMQAKITCP